MCDPHLFGRTLRLKSMSLFQQYWEHSSNDWAGDYANERDAEWGIVYGQERSAVNGVRYLNGVEIMHGFTLSNHRRTYGDMLERCLTVRFQTFDLKVAASRLPLPRWIGKGVN